MLRRIDLGALPRHVAIIMDGNGRWARRRRLPRVAGHRAGIEAVRDTVEAAARLGIEVLTLFAFSLENWKRPRPEVETLMELLSEYLDKERRRLLDNNVRFHVIGRRTDLDPVVRRELDLLEDATVSHTGLWLNIALSYGGRAEIVDACRALLREGFDPERLDETELGRRLYTAGQPDPDLLIRTSGELRVSNFLLWQIAYAEMWVTPTLWPEFRRRHLFEAILDFQGRERRYGGLTPAATGPPVGARR
ncbi:MAG: isoprenyl transferase [Acidobacteriota bacterium]|nr:isoprenyl transferase [Acidobacteriota bacterium]